MATSSDKKKNDGNLFRKFIDWRSIVSGVVGAILTAVVFAASGWVVYVFELVTVPKKAIVAFRDSACPAGWDAYTRGEGRYIVGLNEKGTSEAEVGLKLKDQANFPAGQHTHDFVEYSIGGSNVGNNKIPSNGGSYGQTEYKHTTSPNEGPVGTNAPYVQLLYCEKK